MNHARTSSRFPVLLQLVVGKLRPIISLHLACCPWRPFICVLCLPRLVAQSPKVSYSSLACCPES